MSNCTLLCFIAQALFTKFVIDFFEQVEVLADVDLLYPPMHTLMKGSHNTRYSIPYSSWILCGFFNIPQRTYEQGGYLWDRAYSLKSLRSEKTWTSNRLQMKLQRQHFLLSYFKILSFDPAEVGQAQ